MAPRSNIWNKELIYRMSIPEPNSGCWLWLGNTNSAGYGRTKIGGMYISAHRASYWVFVCEPKNEVLRHTCNTKLCVNPEHLVDGTNFENGQDAIKAGSYKTDRFRLSKKHNRALSDKQIKEIQEKYKGKKKYTQGGITFYDLAIEYNVSLKTIWKAVNNAYPQSSDSRPDSQSISGGR